MVIEAGRVHATWMWPPVWVVTRAPCAENRADALQLHPGLRRVAHDWADDLTGDSGVRLDSPYALNAPRPRLRRGGPAGVEPENALHPLVLPLW
jgi:hypothetical protein